MDDMRAAVFYEHGDRGVIRVESIPIPTIDHDDILVEVKACGMNHLDVFSRRGMPGLPIPLPHISGGDIAGVISRIGSAVTQVEVGDRVMLNPRIIRDGEKRMLGETTWGGLAEYARAPASAAIRIPSEVSFEQAAALPVAYGTAWRMMMTRAVVTSNDTVLVLGASGGVGVACVQISKMAGAKVIAAASADEKLTRLKELGADILLNYSEVADWHRFIRRQTAGEGASIIVDYTGADTWPHSIKAAARGARIVTCGATSGYDAMTDLRYVWTRELDILGSNGWNDGDLVRLVEMVCDRQLEPVIDRTLPLDEVAEAHRLLEHRAVFGKILVKP